MLNITILPRQVNQERIGERSDGASDEGEDEGVVEENPDPSPESGDDQGEEEREAKTLFLNEVVDRETERKVSDEEDDRVEVDIGEGDSELLIKGSLPR